MRLLLDQNIYDSTAQLLIDDGHDVVLAVQLGLARASDEVLLSAADRESRILITRDRDFGNLVFVRGFRTGVIYLRMLPSTQDRVHTQLRSVLNTHDSSRLARAFVVVEADAYRIRNLI